MLDRRLRNAQIFTDTEQRYKNDITLVEGIKKSIKNQNFIMKNLKQVNLQEKLEQL